MDIKELMNKYDITDEDLDKSAQEFENETYEHEDNKVYDGCHLDVLGKKRITVLYDAHVANKVSLVAKAQGVKSSDIYRKAVNTYLATL